MDRKVSDKVAVSINLRGELGKYSLTGKWKEISEFTQRVKRIQGGYYG